MGQGFKWKHSYTAVLIVCTLWFVCHVDRMVMAVAIPYIANEFGLSPFAMGGVMSAFFLGYFICQIPGGLLADRFGARKVLVWAVFWWSVFTAVTGMVSNLVQLLLVRVLFGIGEGMAPAATWKATANWTAMRNRSKASACMMAATVLAPAFAPVFVTWLVYNWGWRPVFYSLFIPGILLIAWIMWKMPDNPADKKGITAEELEELKEVATEYDTTIGAGGEKLTFWQIVKIPAVWRSFLILFCCNMTSYGFISWLPTYLMRVRGFTLTKLGLFASLPFVFGALGFLIAGWLGDGPFRHNRKAPLVVFCWVASGCMYLVYTSSESTLLMYQCLTAFFTFAATGSLYNLPMSAISREITGRAMGFVNMGGQIAGFLTPMIAGWLIQNVGSTGNNFNAAFIYLASMIFIGSIPALGFKQINQQKQEKDKEETA